MEDAPAQQRAIPAELVADSRLPTTIKSIQILRLIAAFSVTVFHGYVAAWGHYSYEDPSLITRAFGLGASGVHVFFVISGFVMVLTTFGGRHYKPGEFLRKRILRIYPIYWVLALIYLLAHATVLPPYPAISVANIVGAFLLLPGPSAAIIGPGWTLSYEMYFYLCFAAALLVPRRYSTLALTSFFLLSIGLGHLGGPHIGVPSLIVDGLLLEFLAGCWIGHAYIGGRRLGTVAAIGAVLASIALFTVGAVLGFGWLPFVLAWGIPSVLLITGLLSLESYFTHPASIFLARLGDSSYFLYLAHVLLIDLALTAIGPTEGWSRGEAALLSLGIGALCVPLSAIGHRMIEMPLLSRMNGLVARFGRSSPRSAISG